MLARSCCLFAAAVASASSWAAAPSYTIIEIRSPSGASDNVTAQAINRYGDVVGSYSSAPGATPATSGAFVYYQRSGSEVSLTPTTAEAIVAANGINDLDLVVGSQTIPSSGVQPIEWSQNGGVQILPANNLALASADDNVGNVIGNIDNSHGDNLAVIWTGPSHEMTGLGVLWVDPALPGYASSTATALNASDHVVGFSFAGQGNTVDTAEPFGVHAFLYRGGQMQDLGGLAPNGPDNDSEAYGINNLDQVVGLSGTTIPAANSQGQPCADCGMASHAFLWRAGTMADLGNLAGIPGWESKADAINDQGEIVGWSDSNVNGAATHRAFLYTDGQMLNLQFYVVGRDPNVQLTEAVDINCAGWIVANGVNVNTPDTSRAYLLIPSGPPRTCP